MWKPLFSLARGSSPAKFLAALALAALVPLSAAAQCFGPYASFPGAQAACANFLSTGFCSSDPNEGAFVEIIGYIMPNGVPAVACCCLALLAQEQGPIEEEAPSPEEESGMSE